MRLLFLSPPFAGHLGRLVPLAHAAEIAGHEVRFLTGHGKRAWLESHGFRIDVPACLPPGALEAISDGVGRTRGRPWRMVKQVQMAARLVGPLVDEITALAAEWRADVIVADSVAIVAGPVAARTSAAWITIAASPVSIESRSGTPGFLGGWSPRGDCFGQVRDAAGRRVIRGAKQLVHRLVRAQVQDNWPVVYRPDGTEAIYAPDRILGLGCEALEFPRDWPPGFQMIGPLFGPPEDLPPLPLAQGKLRALLTAGTHLPWARSQWEQGARALAAAYPDIEFVLSLGQLDGGSVERLTKNLLAVPAVCYHRDLACFDVIVHHGGTGILYATIAAGKPSMVVPMDYDQPDYAARIVWHGLGLQGRHPGDTATFGKILRQEWPGCRTFQDLAAAAEPEAAFLSALAQVKRSA